MTLLWVCSRGHRWEARGNADARGQLCAECPTCGDPGSVSASRQFDETIVPEQSTVSPGAIPSLVASLPDHSGTTAPIVRLRATPLRIGNYDVVAELGRGGMGVVYQARHHGLDRFVAIKMILAGGYASEESVRRLRTEAEAVARLQHPNVVQIYDVGEHDGQPFLVLEYLEGGNLAQRVAGKPQSPRVAAQLIQTLSRTIDYAHANGILHRDLTPSNVLLSEISAKRAKDPETGALDIDLERATPKITDFGLAKRLDDGVGHTRTGAVMGTPGYMSPEQAMGNAEVIGPSCDIYSLGAMLYELLTGRPPFVGETALDTLEQVIRQEPVPPTRLHPKVPRDLETICLKCLEKEPAKRYATAGEIADDLERYRKGEPILARRAGTVLRLWRWSKRRPAAAALILVSVLAAVTLLAGSYWSSSLVRNERDRAEEHLSLALRAVDGMLTEVGEQDFAYEPRLDEKRQALLARALALYQEFLAKQADNTRLQLETAQAFRRMGDIERWLGQQERAEAAYVQAIQLIDRLRNDQPADPRYERWLAYCHNYLGEVHRQSSQPKLAEQSYRRAYALSERLHREFPENVEYAQELARAQYNSGILCRETNRHDEAERNLSQSAELLQTLAETHAEDPSIRQELARAHINLGTVFRATGRRDRAIESSDRAIVLLDELATRFPLRPDYRFELAVVHSNRGNLHARTGATAAALVDYQEGGSLLESLIADFPTAPALRQELANTYNSLAALQAATGNLAEAERTWTLAVDLLRELVTQHASAVVYRADLGMALGNLGWAMTEQKQFTAARELIHEGVRLLDDALLSNPDHPDYGLSLRSQLRELGRVFLELHDHVAAVDAAHRLATLPNSSGNDPLAAACLMVRAAAVAGQDSLLTESARLGVVERYFNESATLVRSAAVLGVSDTTLLEQARELFRPEIKRRPDLAAACAALFSPASAEESAHESGSTP